jgi:hypothetical protein
LTKPTRKDGNEYFVVPIERWNWSFSYGLNDVPGLRPGTYVDYRHLYVFGDFLRPRRLAGQRVELSFVPSGASEEPTSPPLVKPDRIGNLWSDPPRKRFLAVLSMPGDALASVLTMLVAKRLRYVVLIGSRLSRDGSAVRHYSLEADDENLPAADARPDEDRSEIRLRSRRTLRRR